MVSFADTSDLWHHVITGCLSSLFVYVVYTCFQPLKAWQYRKIPGPPGLPLLGNGIAFAAKGGHEYMADCALKYGPIFKLWVGTTPWVVVTDPDSARRVLTRLNDRVPQRLLVRSQQDADITAANLLSANGTMWRKARNAWQPFFQPDNMSALISEMDRSADRLLNRLDQLARQDAAVDIWRELGTMTLDIIGTTAFGVDFHTFAAENSVDHQKGSDLFVSLRAVLSQGNIAQQSPYSIIVLLIPELAPLCRFLGNYFPDAKLRAVRAGVDHVRGFSLDLVQSQLKGSQEPDLVYSNGRLYPASRGQDWTSESHQPTSKQQQFNLQNVEHGSERHYVGGFLPLLGQRLTKSEMLSQSAAFCLAGYETTTTALSMAVYEISRHPDVERLLLKEIDAFGRDKELAYEELQNFPYIDALIKEVLRLHMPVASMNRQPVEDLDVLGYTIPKGSNITLNFWGMHHDPASWPDPWEFRPERFLPGAKAEQLDLRAYLPFGGGARLCVGAKFALQEIKLTIIRLYQQFVFRLEGGADTYPPIKMQFGFALTPEGGVRVRVIKRTW